MIITEQASRKRVDVCPVPREGRTINLKLLARQYETEGFPVPATPDALQQRYYRNPEQRAIDLYALGVPVVRDVVASTVKRRNERQPYGLVQRLGADYAPVQYFRSSDPYGQLRENMNDTLLHATDEYLDPENLVARFAINPHAKRNHEVFTHLAEDRSGSAKAFIALGINTATNIMPAALRLVPDLYRKQFHHQPDSDTATQIAKDNYPFLSRLAVAHLIPFVELTDRVGGRNKQPINPQYCEFKTNERHTGGLELQFTEKTQRQLVQAFGGWLNDPIEGVRIRMGCIAAHSGALRSLWDWHTDIGEAIYKQQLPSRPEQSMATVYTRPSLVFSK